MSVQASIQVSFGAGVDTANAHLSAEIDSREAGLNAGATSFAPGDTAYFLVYKSDNVSYSPPVASAGSISTAGTQITVEKEEDVQFADADTATLGVPSSAVTSVTWLGRSLGSLTLQADRTTLKASAKGVAVARVKYNCKADAFGLVSPATLAGLTDFSILVYILGHLAGETG